MVDKSTVHAHFASIAARYDLMNHLLSFGQDWFWRRRVARSLPLRPGQDYLDVCTGTGDLLLAFARRYPEVRCTGLDLTEAMLEAGRAKAERHGFEPARITWVRGDAEELPWTEGSFDVATMAFGLRNLPDSERGLRQLHRVLRPGGRVGILEFVPPGSGVFGRCYRAYLHHAIPRLGGWITGATGAYRHLSTSVQGFWTAAELAEALERVGFSRGPVTPLSGGVAVFVQAVKGDNGHV